jgi:hypothetical protein
MSLIKLPGNNGCVFAVDAHTVTGVQPYRSTLPGKGTQVFDMCAVWTNNREIFVCAWSVETTIDRLNKARQADADLFAAGYRAVLPDAEPEALSVAWKQFLAQRREIASGVTEAAS